MHLRSQNLYVDGFVLVGGASSRMNRDKAQIILGGMSLAERAAAVLDESGCESIFLVGGRSDQFFAGVKDKVAALPDLHITGENIHRAALVGLYTALVKATAPWIMVIACDLPFVTAELMTKLVGFCANEFDAVVPLQHDTTPQPLCALYRRERCLPVVERMLKSEDLKLQRVLSRITTRYVAFDDISRLEGSANFFMNINTPEDYESASRIAAS